MHLAYAIRFNSFCWHSKKLPRELFCWLSIGMIDIVTVVFAQEISVLQVQAQSIDRFCKDLGLKNIYVMINDHDDLIKQIDRTWWGQFQDRVRILPKSMFSTDYVANGWVSQQVLKLLGAALSHNHWSMILDAKTLITDHMSADMFVITDCESTLGRQPIQPVFEPAAKIAGDVFDIKIDHVIAPAGVPFFFHNRTVRQMIAQIENRTGQHFPEWFQQQGMLTEFVLYSGFVQYKHQNLNSMYLGTNTQRLCNNVCHSEVNLFDIKLNLVLDQRSTTMGVHRNAWAQLSTSQQQNYVAYLQSLGLDRAGVLL